MPDPTPQDHERAQEQPDPNAPQSYMPSPPKYPHKWDGPKYEDYASCRWCGGVENAVPSDECPLAPRPAFAPQDRDAIRQQIMCLIPNVPQFEILREYPPFTRVLIDIAGHMHDAGRFIGERDGRAAALADQREPYVRALAGTHDHLTMILENLSPGEITDDVRLRLENECKVIDAAIRRGDA